MPKPSGNTSVLQPLLDRLANGDQKAADELIEQAMERLRHLAKRMLGNNPAVHRWEETDDVFQNSLIRLHRALKTTKPGNVKYFINLAAAQIRRELIDLYRHYYGPAGLGANQKTGFHARDGEASPIERPDDADGPATTLRRQEFHSIIEKLPPKEAEVVSLTIYWGFSQDEIADRLKMSVPTVKRRMRAAMVRLADLLNEAGESDPSVLQNWGLS